MNHFRTILAALLLAAAPAAGQTIKTLGYNTTNGNVVAATNLIFTNTNTTFQNATISDQTLTLSHGPEDDVFIRNESGNLELGSLTNVFFWLDSAVQSARFNVPVTASNLTTSGTLTATGNVTMAGTGNTAPNQTASSGSSLMTRDLVREEIATPRALDSIYWFGLYGQGSVWATAGNSAVIALASRHTANETGFAMGLTLRTSARIGTNVAGAGLRLGGFGVTGDGPFKATATSGDWQMEAQVCPQIFVNSTNAVAFVMASANASSMWHATNTVGIYYVPQPTNTWVSNAAVAQHDRINVGGVVWAVQTAGTNAATEPTWTDLIGSTVTNGSAVYINAGPHTSNNWVFALGHTNASQVVMTNTGKSRYAQSVDVRLYVRYATNDNRWYASVEDNIGRSSEVSLTNVSSGARTPQFWTRYDSTNTVAGDQLILMRYLAIRSLLPAL